MTWSKSVPVAAFLVLCVIFGGSAQGIWSNFAIQFGGVCLLAFAAIYPDARQDPRRAAFLKWLLVAVLAIVVLQLLPLPASLWTQLPGRHDLAADIAALGYALTRAPLSLSPYSSLQAIFAFIPALAVFGAVVRLNSNAATLALAAIAGVVLSIVVGAVQIAGGPQSAAYFYPITSGGAVGFFANGNHMAALLLAGIPLTAALMSRGSGGQLRSRSKFAIGVSVMVLILVGILLNNSLAAFGLVVPVAIATTAIFPAGFRHRKIIVPAAALILLAGVAMVALKPIGTSPLEADAAAAVNSRVEIWSMTGKAIESTFPVGTGLGTFPQAFHLVEDPASVAQEYVNHAHNDYLELVLELGLPGLIFILLFLGWWGMRAARIWASRLSTPFERAATIVTAALLAHSLVDYPLRTAALSSLFAFAVALMARRSTGEGGARHVKLG